LPDRIPDSALERSKVVLVGFETKQDRYEAIKTLAELLGTSFDEAADLADSVPVDLVPSLPTEAADNLAEKLGAAGALIEVLPLTKRSRFCHFHPHKYARTTCRTCGRYICNLCLVQSKGKRYCAEHYEEYRQKRVLVAVGGAFVILLTVFLLLLFRENLAWLWRSVSPQGKIKVAAVFVSEKPDEFKGAYFMNVFRDDPKPDYAPGDDHTIMDIPSWFNKEYRRITDKDDSFMSLEKFGFYKIDIVPPMPMGKGSISYKALKHFAGFRSYFRGFASKNNLPQLNSFDVVLMIDLVDETDIDKDFMEQLGFTGGSFAFMKIPVKNVLWSNDYYVAAAAHYIAQCMGATVKLNERGFPKNPEGLANPTQSPPYAQSKAALMGCYRAVNTFQIERPASMDNYVISPLTAYEFGWISPGRIKNLYPNR